MNAGGLGLVLVDDEPAVTRALSMALFSNGYERVTEFNDSREALRRIEEEGAELVVCDLGMPHLSGMDMLERLRQTRPDIPLLVATAVNEVDTAVRCMKLGARDYLVKPIKEGELIKAVRVVLEISELRRENDALRERLTNHALRCPAAFAGILTNNPQMHALFEYMEVVAPASQPVLIQGETGTGKELIARALHDLRRKGEFVAVNIAGLDETAFSDTLFGHLKGAFTGAANARAGLIERAGDGTVFLDEIGDLSPGAQVKLLRLLQEKEYMPLGCDEPRRTSARFVLATLRDLAQMVEKGTFRRDLYYRLRQYQLHIPPLRERKEDLLLLTEHFLHMAAADLGLPVPPVPAELPKLLGMYSFPGNIREMQALINAALSHSKRGTLSLEYFRKHLNLEQGLAQAHNGELAGDFLQGLPALPPLKSVRHLLVKEAVRRASGNQTLAAGLLGVTRQAISKHLKNSDD